MEFQTLYELADRELTVGLADESCLERAQLESKGVNALVRQLYCEIRAKSLYREVDKPAGRANVVSLTGDIERMEKRLRARKERNRWFWAVMCFIGIAGSVAFPRLAISSFSHHTLLFYVYAVLGVAFLALTVISYTASRYHTHTD